MDVASTAGRCILQTAFPLSAICGMNASINQIKNQFGPNADWVIATSSRVSRLCSLVVIQVLLLFVRSSLTLLFINPLLLYVQYSNMGPTAGTDTSSPG